MSGEEQRWDGAVNIGFGDENFNDIWPSSTQSPGPSPQPSPDSQLFDPTPMSSDTLYINQGNIKSCSNQGPAAGSQQNSLVSQSNLPPSSKQLTSERNILYSQPHSLPNTSSHQVESHATFPQKNIFHHPNAQIRPSSRPTPSPSFKNVQQLRPQNKVPPSQNSNANAQFQQGQYSPGPLLRPARPAPAGPTNIRAPSPGNVQSPPRQSMKLQPNSPLSSQAPLPVNQSTSQQPPKANPMISQSTHPTHQHRQQQHFQPQSPPIRQQTQMSPPQPGHHQQRPSGLPNPNPNSGVGGQRMMPPHGQFNHGMPQPRPQGATPGQPNTRMPPPGRHQDHRMRMGGPRPPAGRMMRPPHPAANANPRMAGPRHPASGQQLPPNQVARSPQGMQANAPQSGRYPTDYGYEEYFDDEEFEDEDEEEEYEEDLYENMPYRGRNMPYGEYDSEDSISDSSEEDRLLRDYIECDDDEQAEFLYDQLKARGVTQEEIEMFRENYTRTGGFSDMDYDEEDDEMGEEDYPDEEIVSSSTTLNSQMGGAHNSQQVPPPAPHAPPPIPGARPSVKEGPPLQSHQTTSSSFSSPSNHHPPRPIPPLQQGIQAGPRPQFNPIRPPSSQGYAMAQRRPAAPVHVTSSSGGASTSLPQGGQTLSHPTPPRQPSPVKSQSQAPTQQTQAFHQGGGVQRPTPMASSSLSNTAPSTEDQNLGSPRQSSPLQQHSPTGHVNPRIGPPQSQASAPPQAQGSPNAFSTAQPQPPVTAAPTTASQIQPQPATNQLSGGHGIGGNGPSHSDGTGYSSSGQQSPSPVRPVHHRPPLPQHQHRFPQAQLVAGQSNPSFQRGPRMHGANSRHRAPMMGENAVPSEAQLSRMAVLKMQQSLDMEIKAKKGTAMPPNYPTRPNEHFHPRHHHPGGRLHPMVRPRLQNPAMMGSSSQFVRHQLPPRTPFPRMQGGPRPTRVQTVRPVCSVPPFTSHPPQQNTQPSPRPPHQGNAGNIPRPRNPAPQLPPTNPSHSPGQNQTSSPAASQSTVGAHQAGMRAPSPRVAPPPSGQVVNQNQSENTQAQAPSTMQAPAGPQPPPQLPQQLPPQQLQQQQQPQPQQQQQNVTPTKSEGLNLNTLSEDKFIIKGSTQQRLVANTVYQIKSPLDQTSKLARWNGERFVDLETVEKTPPNNQQKAPVAQQSQQPPLVSNIDNQSTSTATSLEPANPTHTRDEEKESEDTAASQSTYVKPLEEDNPAAEENEEDDFIFKKPLNDNEEHFRVCNYCGYTSKNFKRCEGCRRIFQGPVKIHVQKKKNAPTSSAPSSPNKGQAIVLSKSDNSKNPDPFGDVMANVDFYGNRRGRGRSSRGLPGRTRGGGMKSRMAGKKGQDDYDSSDSEDSVDKRNCDGPPAPLKRKVGRGRAKGSAPRKKSKKVDEPVTVMISSDEDEPSSTSSTPQGAWPPPSPSSSAGSESPIFPGRHVEPPSTYGRFRRMLMEDEQGNSKLNKKLLQQQALEARGVDEEDFDDEDDDDDSDEPPTYEIEIRSIRVGSMRTKPEGPLFINMRGVCFRVRSERTEEAFECEIMSTEVEYVKYYGGQSPVLFFLITHECGEKLRDIFRMEKGGDEYLDPSSTDLKQKMVVIIVESSNYLPQDMRETLSLWADINHVDDSEFIEELSEESANDLLIQSAPAVLTADVEHDMMSFKKTYIKTEGKGNLSVMPSGRSSPSNMADNEPDSTSSSPPQPTELHQYFDGPPIRLLQYPPPPARGIPITTEDLICLHEGEFLNDVIIDFYLQYLYQERLDEDVKKRTHIFSSFFYKRLTQRDRHSEKTEEDAKKSIAERRHARVKKWTKTVDLFSKDFIIVPINENSHWYLAVICFPGLAAPEVAPFIPSTIHNSEADNESNDGEQSEEGASAKEEKNSSSEAQVKTIFGKSVDPKSCSGNDESKYSLGQKAPCILMFDSLAGPSRTPNVKMLRDYLQCEWNAKKSEARPISKLLRGSTPKVPQQSNFSDCGVYLLQYVESFFEDPIADFQIPMKGLQQWFTEKLIVNKRQEIHELIMRLHRRHQEERGDPKILDIRYVSGPLREEPPPLPPPNFHPHPDQLHPHPHDPHLANHPGHPMMPEPPHDEQHWSGHPGFPAHDGGEMDPGQFMDSGDSSNSGSMGDMEEQNFLYPSSQEQQMLSRGDGQTASSSSSSGSRQGNAAAGSFSESEGGPPVDGDEKSQNNHCANMENVDVSANHLSDSQGSHQEDFLSQPSPTSQPQQQLNEDSENNLPHEDQRNGDDYDAMEEEGNQMDETGNTDSLEVSRVEEETQ